MSSTLVLEEAVEQVFEADVAPPAQTSLREFCFLCFTDRVAVLASGAVYCPDCGHTSSPIWPLN